MPPGRRFALAAALCSQRSRLLPLVADDYALVLGGDMLIFALFAVSLHFIMGPGGMASFGHAAYFGLGACAPRRWRHAAVPMELALIAGAARGGHRSAGLRLVLRAPLGRLPCDADRWRSPRSPGPLVYQWDALTGGSNGLVGVWPAPWFVVAHALYYWLTLAIAGGAIALLWRIVFAPFGYALRAARDSPLRAEPRSASTCAPCAGPRFALAGLAAGLAGSLYAFSKGSISPESLSIPAFGRRTGDGAARRRCRRLLGPAAPARLCSSGLQDTLARHTEYWRAMLGAAILVLVLLFSARHRRRIGWRRTRSAATRAPALAVRGGTMSAAGPLQGANRAPPGQCSGAGHKRGGPMTAPLLSVHDIAKAFGGVQALAGVSFDVAAGRTRRASSVPTAPARRPCSTSLTASSRPIAAARPWRDGH